MKEIIEIPFGAKNSELRGWEYTIPEGMEATIVDNKIVVKNKESEDEKIRKGLIEYIKDQQSTFISAPDCRDKYEEEENNKYNSWIAWLEKQCEQKPTDEEMKILLQTEYEKGRADAIEQTSTWSEEDEAIYYGVIETEQYMLDVVNGTKKFDVGNLSIKKECTRELNWLKSFKERYTWKPSDEQIKALKEACDKYWEPDGLDPLYTLYQDLKKLREE